MVYNAGHQLAPQVSSKYVDLFLGLRQMRSLRQERSAVIRRKIKDPGSSAVEGLWSREHILGRY